MSTASIAEQHSEIGATDAIHQLARVSGARSRHDDHWRAREAAERAAAKRAVTSKARGHHQELAQIYARMLRGETR